MIKAYESLLSKSQKMAPRRVARSMLKIKTRWIRCLVLSTGITKPTKMAKQAKMATLAKTVKLAKMVKLAKRKIRKQ